MSARRILAALVLPMALGAQAPAAASALPDARALIARHDSLVGGRAALDAHRSMKTIGTFSFPLAGVDAPLELLKVRPDRFLLRIAIANFGDVMQGYDGEVAWAVQPNSPATVLEGFGATRVKEQGDFFGNLHDLSRFSSVETVADTVFEGTRVYKVKFTRPEGDIIFEYFNAVTGLSAGGSSQVVTPTGPVENLTVFEEYRAFGNLRLATRVVQRQPGNHTVFTIVSVEFDTVDSTAVRAPDAVQALKTPTTRPPVTPHSP